MSSQKFAISNKANRKPLSFGASPVFNSLEPKNKQVKVYHIKEVNSCLKDIKSNLENGPILSISNNLEAYENNILSDKSVQIKVKKSKHVRFSI
jgi:hypothetical protein